MYNCGFNYSYYFTLLFHGITTWRKLRTIMKNCNVKYDTGLYSWISCGLKIDHHGEHKFGWSGE